MSEVKLIKLKFKNGKKQTWLRWAETLMVRKDEVLVTLENEGVVSESCFLSDDGEHVYYFMEAENETQAHARAQQSVHPIDIEHRNIREECLEPVAKLETLFHFENRRQR